MVGIDLEGYTTASDGFTYIHKYTDTVLPWEPK